MRPHTKQELISPTLAKGKSMVGVGRDGGVKGIPNVPAHHGPAVNAETFKGHSVPGNIARDGAPKAHHHIPPHGGNISADRHGQFHFGGDAASASDASAPNTLDPTRVGGKRLTPPAPAFGQRSRTAGGEVENAEPGVHAKKNRGNLDTELGAAILREATRTR